jgi:pyruvate,water dikinase
MPSTSTNKRLPFFIAGHAHELVLAPRRLRAFAREQRAWWRTMTSPSVVASAGAAERLREAHARFDAAMVEHTSGSVLAMEMFGLLYRLAAESGEHGLEAELATGYGDLEEAALVADLWAVSRGDLPLEEFIVHHGFHGPEEGQLQSVSWRENSAPLATLLERYRELPESEWPAATARTQVAARRRAEATLLTHLPRRRRGRAKLVLRLARVYIPLREVGKAAFLMAIDVARSAARARGTELVAQGLLDDPEDAWFLTLDELTDAAPPDARERVAERRARHARYQKQALPRAWVGEPTPVDETMHRARPTELATTRLQGVAIVPGVVEARARVALDCSAALKIQPGEVLVCRTTDPSWAPVFPLAGALVIDIGGPMSHGAIVARELGTPCVIATGHGTEMVPDGALVRVDAGQGVLEVLEQPS